MSETYVTRVDTQADDEGLSVTVQIDRHWSAMGRPTPRVEDVPDDIRAALLAWLNPAPTEDAGR